MKNYLRFVFASSILLLSTTSAFADGPSIIQRNGLKCTGIGDNSDYILESQDLKDLNQISNWHKSYYPNKDIYPLILRNKSYSNIITTVPETDAIRINANTPGAYTLLTDLENYANRYPHNGEILINYGSAENQSSFFINVNGASVKRGIVTSEDNAPELAGGVAYFAGFHSFIANVEINLSRGQKFKLNMNCIHSTFLINYVAKP